MELAGLNIKFLPGVGEKKEELQVQSYEDMLYHVPFKYIDRSKIYSIAELNGRLPYIQIKAKIRNLKTIGEGKALRMTATAYDETGTLELVWFKGFKFLTNQIEPDKEYLIFGQPSEFNHKLNIVHPEIDSFEKASQLLVGFQAVYPTTEKMKKAFLNSKAISKIQDSIFKTIKGKISETLPAWFIQQHKLMYLHEALYNIHFPENPDMLRKALFRLKFEELFYIQLNILKHIVYGHPVSARDLGSGKASLIAHTAADALFRIEQHFPLEGNGFRIVTPLAPHIAALQKDCRPNSRAVMNGAMLQIRNHPRCRRRTHFLFVHELPSYPLTQRIC